MVSKIITRSQSLMKELLAPCSKKAQTDVDLETIPAESRSYDEPLLFHCPRGESWNGMIESTYREFRNYAEDLLTGKTSVRVSPDLIDRVEFVTYSTYRHKTLLERVYEKYSIPSQVLGRDLQNWSWLSKIQLVLRFLESRPRLKDYVLVTDAADVVLTRSPDPLVELFSTYQAGVIFCNTCADWPPNTELRNFENSCYGEFPLHAHLSAGAYFGRSLEVLSYLSEIEEAHHKGSEWCFYRGRFNDQLAWRHLHRKHYPKIKVDYRSLLFKRFDLFRHLNY